MAAVQPCHWPPAAAHADRDLHVLPHGLPDVHGCSGIIVLLRQRLGEPVQQDGNEFNGFTPSDINTYELSRYVSYANDIARNWSQHGKLGTLRLPP